MCRLGAEKLLLMMISCNCRTSGWVILFSKELNSVLGLFIIDRILRLCRTEAA
jgi:hypothetical protein